MKQRKRIRCPMIYTDPDTTELDKYILEGWEIVKVRYEPEDCCVFFIIEKEGNDVH